MSGRTYVSPEMKIRAVEGYLSGTEKSNMTAKRFGVNRSTFEKWLLNYELFGKESLYLRTKNQHYSEAVKQQAVELYLSGQMSEKMVCKKYQIRSQSQLEKWISWYNGQKEFRPAGGSRSGTRMTRNYEERKRAVEYCLAHDRNYALTASIIPMGTIHQISAVFGVFGIGSICRRKRCSHPRKAPAEYVAENILSRRIR